MGKPEKDQTKGGCSGTCWMHPPSLEYLLFLSSPCALLRRLVLSLLAHVLALMAESFVLLALCRLVHAGNDDLLGRFSLSDATDIALLVITGDCFGNGLFKFPQKKSVFRSGIGNSDAGCAGSSRTSDSVDVVFQISRDIIIEYVRDAFDIKTACRNI